MHQAIFRTLTYSSLFSYPLTVGEIHTYLIGKKASFNQVRDALKKSSIKSEGKYFYLKNKQHVLLRKKRQKIANHKIKRANMFAKILKIFPPIQAVGITGALAMKNTDVHDDIDLLIITNEGKLWTTRFFVNLLFDILQIRRKPESKQISDKACLNLWLTKKGMKISKKSQNIYRAHEVAQVKFIWAKNNMDKEFLSQNEWINEFLPNISIPPSKLKPPTSKKENKIEKIFYFLQRKIMQSKITTERISINKAFFHPSNTNEEIQKEYNKKEYNKAVK